MVIDGLKSNILPKTKQNTVSRNHANKFKLPYLNSKSKIKFFDLVAYFCIESEKGRTNLSIQPIISSNSSNIIASSGLSTNKYKYEIAKVKGKHY